jgi:hypothetical protein
LLISLLVASMGRKDALGVLFANLCQQSHQDFEILLADMNPQGFLDELLADYSPRLRIQRVSLSPRGLSAARNALLPLGKGEILAFPDDDCFYAVWTLEAADRLFAAQKLVDVLLGRLHTPDRAAHHQRPAAFEPATRDQGWLMPFRQACSVLQFYRRALVEKIGLFDEELGIGAKSPWQSGEESDYLLRAVQHGAQVARSADLAVYHPETDPRDQGLIAKSQGYGQGRMRLLHKHRAPLWFELMNLGYPLARMLVEGPGSLAYHWAMFQGRCKAFCRLKTGL